MYNVLYSHCNSTREAFFKLNPPCAWIGGMESLLALEGNILEECVIFKLRLIYAVFMTFNHVNHNPNASCNVPSLIIEFFKQGRWKRS